MSHQKLKELEAKRDEINKSLENPIIQNNSQSYSLYKGDLRRVQEEITEERKKLGLPLIGYRNISNSLFDRNYTPGKVSYALGGKSRRHRKGRKHTKKTHKRKHSRRY